MPNLTIRENGSETVFQVSEKSANIGRGEHNDVRVQDPRASKEHCRIVEQNGRWKMVDLESHNGTRVNGDFRNKAWLDHGDTIRIGQSEIRFGLEGRSRARAAARTETDEEAPPPRRYQGQKGGEKLLIYGGALLGVLLLFAFAANMASKTMRDTHNEAVLEHAEKLFENGQYDEAQRYIMEHADSSGNLYGKLMERAREFESRKPLMEGNVRAREAHQLLSRIANKIANYDRGGSAEPAVILRMMKQLKTDYAGTEQDLQAQQTYPEWYAGTVPEPGIDRKNPRRKLRREWEAVCEQADGYRKQEHFREARETLERFVRVRESTLEQVDLDWLNGELEKRVGNIERLAGTYFHSTERRARDLVKKKRWDQAIQLYRNVIANYGIDKYVRKAKEAIAEIEEARANEPGGKSD
ncbi:MAG: FHA domain-containing protein [Planctomycetota bacterium]